jgi:hypothetical protein
MFINYIQSQFEKTIDNGIITRAVFPMYMYYRFGYFAYIYTNIEIGIGRNVWITGIRFNMVGDATSNREVNNQTLKLSQVNSNIFPPGTQNNMSQLSAIFTTVKSNFVWTVPEDFNNWLEIEFDTPYNYNPTNNLLVLWENRNGAYVPGTSLIPYSKCTSNGLNNTYYSIEDALMPSPTTIGTIDNTGRPNIQLIIKI